MQSAIPQLLLADRLTPITNEIGFLDLPFERALAAYIEWQEPIWRKDAVLTTKRIQGGLETILRGLEPLQSIQNNRVALIPTATNWTGFFDNRDVGPYLDSAMYSLSKRTGRQTLLLTVTLNEIDGRQRATAFLDSTKFHLRGPTDRYLQAWINDTNRWTWDVSGEMQPFERPELYEKRRIRDRLTIETMTEYAAALELRPFDADFYAPDGFGAIVELTGWVCKQCQEVSLAQVQARPARDWHNLSSY